MDHIHMLDTADYFVYAARADGIPDGQIAATATDARLRHFTGADAGWQVLTATDCRAIRRAIRRAVRGQ